MKLPNYLKLPMGIQSTGEPMGREYLTSSDGGMVATAYSHSEAAYIVNAVNTHEALVEALEAVASWDWSALRNAPGHTDWDYALKDMERAAKALAAAKGGSHD